jgi:hypothetical protein
MKMLESILRCIERGNYWFTIHGFGRCVERGIAPEEVKYAIIQGEIIEHYPEDKYGPSCLIPGKTRNGKILHVHCSIDPVWIITSYDPTLNPDEWDAEFKKRRREK